MQILSDAQAQLDEDDPVKNGRGFRQTLGQFSTGVTVITVDSGKRITGVTANSFSSVSLDPPLILWSIKRGSDSLGEFSDDAHFAVNVLASNQTEIASNFARSGEKFGGVDWTPGLGGAPLIRGVAAQFECRQECQYDGGDHIILVGRVERYRRFDRPVLIFSQGRYGLVVDHPGDAMRAGATQQPPSELKPLLSNRLRQAVVGFSASLGRHFSKLDITLNESRMLANLAYFPGKTLTEIAEATFLGERSAEDTAHYLVQGGYALRTTAGVLEITDEGRERLDVIRREALACEANHLAGTTPADIEATFRVLDILARGSQK